MNSDKADAEDNLKAFLEKHGDEGFLKLLITNYLFELAMYYLHSDKNPGAQIREDTSYRFYVDGQEHAYPPESIEQFKNDLRTECQKKADHIVKLLEEKNIVKKMGRDILKDPEAIDLIDGTFNSLVRPSR